VLADHVDDAVRGLDSRIDHDPLTSREPGNAVTERFDDTRSVGTEDPRFGDGRQPLADPDVEMVERGGAQPHEHLARAGDGIRNVLEHEHVRAAVLVDTNCLHARQTIGVRGVELERVAEELGLDVVGAAPAQPYAETERHIRERRARGLFADMKFTMARPHESCHPETLLEDARTVVSAALCYYAEEPGRPEGHGRLPRYTWFDAYAELRTRLDELGRRIGGAYRVLVDANQHVDREAAARSGVGFYGKNTVLITQRHGSWVVLGTLISDRELEPTPPLELDCGSCRLCIDACPTGALDEPGTLDANRCLSYWTQAPAAIPEPYRAEHGAMLYGCDICQDVCPWNRGVEKRRRGSAPPEGADPHPSLVDWLQSDAAELRRRYERLYVPRNDARWLRRNALVAAGNAGGPAERAAVGSYVAHEDAMLREHAAWALRRMEERGV